MAITSATTISSDFSGFLTPSQAGPIFEIARDASVVQRLGQRVELGPSGVSVPVVTGRISAGWVDEGATKPASEGSLELKTMTPKKIAAIAVVSAEVVRANPGGYMNLIRQQVGEAFAESFDSAALHGTSTPFAAYLDQTAKAVEIGAHTDDEGGVWQDLVSALRLLVENGKRLTGWAIDDVVEPALLGSVDANGRPIFVDTPLVDTAQGAARPGRLMGRPSYMSPNVGTADNDTVVGYGGDWSQVAWGQVGGISFDVSTEASVTINGSLVSLWEKNLVAVRAETEFGLIINDAQAFCRLSNLIGS